MHNSIRSLALGALLCGALSLACAAEVGAQTIGVFRWQLQPYCNVLTLTIAQSGAVYSLDGFDDQCGAAQRASVVGTAVPNADGSIKLGVATVLAPSGTPVHVDARITVASLGGTWKDSAGNTGTLVFTPGPGTGGSPRPVAPNGLAPGSVGASQVAAGAIGSAQIDASQVQARVAGSCSPGTFIRIVNANGSVQCGSNYFAGEIPLDSTTFDLKTIPAVGSVAELSTLSIQMPREGTIVVRSRGYCSVQTISGQDNTVSISAGTSAAQAFPLNSGATTWGVISIPPSSTLATYKLGWTSERRLNLAPGAHTIGLFGRHDSGSTTTDCSGSFSVSYAVSNTVDQ